MPGICFLHTWKQHSHCPNLNLSLNHGLGRHVHVLYVLLCCKKYPPTYWLLVTGSVAVTGLVASCRVVAATTFFGGEFKIHACQRDEGIVILAGFFAGFTGWCLSTTSSVSGGGSHVGMTAFSFQWITTELFFMKSHIYLKFYPFLWMYCHKIVFSYFMCTLFQTLFLSTSLLLGSFRYVFNIIIVLTCIVSICRF